MLSIPSLSSKRSLLRSILLLLLGGSFAVAPLAAGASPPEDRIQDAQNTAVSLLAEYLRIDTTNPPGNEWRGVDFFARIFEQEGIAYETAESAPGRGNIWARLEGGDEPGIVLLHHMDVVPSDARYWDEDPLSGAIRDGYLYGRGALDTKGLGILHLQTFLELHRRGEPLRRDVIFMATADEEAGGFYGAGWLVANRPEIFEGVGLLLNEGGGGMKMGPRPVFSVEVTQKVPLWLRLKTTGIPGHGSSPRADTAVTRLIEALDRFIEHDIEPRVVPEVGRYFRGLSEINPRHSAAFLDIDESVHNPDFMARLQRENPPLHALLRNTCSITRLEGSPKINVVPADAIAELDCRLLPDQDPERFKAELRDVLDEPGLEIETLMSFTPAVSSTDTELYRVIERTCLERFPDALVLPSVVGGFTDSHFFRDLGIVSYGFRPSLLPTSEASGVHGNNERIEIDDLKLGVAMMLEILEAIVYG